jgi:hypothetical protein
VAQAVRIRVELADIHNLVGEAVANMDLMEEAVALVGLVVEVAKIVARTGSAVLGAVLVEHLAEVGNRFVRSLEVAGWEHGKIGDCPRGSRKY